MSSTQQDSPPRAVVRSSNARRWWLRWRRVVAVVAGLLAIVVVVLTGVVIGIDRSIDRVEVQGLADGDDPNAVPEPTAPTDDEVAAGRDPDPGADAGTGPGSDAGDVTVAYGVDAVTVLVLGSDTREVLTPAERTELGTGDAWGERTEVVALVRFDPVRDEIRMLNVPRDSVVTRCDGSRGRINAAYIIGEHNGVGGMSCVVSTLTEWSGLGIDHAMKVDFRGFIDIVDAIGGVEFQLDERLQDRRANLDLEAGCVRLDGAEALAFARARGIDDDFGRIARQQRLITEMRAELGEAGVLTNPVRLVRTAEAIARAVELDDRLTLNRIRRLVTAHRSTLRGDIEARTVPGERTTGTEAWLLAPDQQAARELFRWLEQGDRNGSSGGGDTEAAGREGDADDTAASPQDEPPAGSSPQRCD